ALSGKSTNTRIRNSTYFSTEEYIMSLFYNLLMDNELTYSTSLLFSSPLMPSKRLHLVTAIAVIASCLTASGLTIHTDFNSGLLEDAWRQPDGDDIVVADAGPDGVGDYAVRVAMDGGDNKVHFMTGNTGGQ